MNRKRDHRPYIAGFTAAAHLRTEQKDRRHERHAMLDPWVGVIIALVLGNALLVAILLHIIH